MWHLTAWKNSASLSFLNWIKNPNEIIFIVPELMLPALMVLKNHFIFDPVQERETNWKFKGC